MNTLESLVSVLREGAASGVFPPNLATAVVTPETTLGSLGIDEVGRIELMEEMMTVSGKTYSLDKFHDNLTVAEILRIVNHAKVQ